MERFDGALLRRVAIVLSSLPDATADRLLSRFDHDQQNAVRLAWRNLDEVDPLERRRALDGFASSLHQQQSGRQSVPVGTEVVFSRVALGQIARHEPQPASPAIAPQSSPAEGQTGASPFAFLADVADDVLAFRIQDEHPQTVAIILASIAPAQAARLLPKLGVALRAETMRRLAKMEMPLPEVVDDLAQQLKQKLGPQATHSGVFPPAAIGDSHGGGAAPSVSAGKAALQAILVEMNHSGAAPTVTPTFNSDLSRYRQADPVQGGHWPPVDSRHPDELSPSAVAASRLGTATTGNTFPVPPRDHPTNSPSPRPVAGSGHHADDDSEDHRDDQARLSPETVRRLLTSAPAETLREALASVDGRQAMLALCGLPNRTANAVLAILPRRQAKSIRQQLAQLGQLDLRQIDQAKAEVARVLSNKATVDHQRRATA